MNSTKIKKMVPVIRGSHGKTIQVKESDQKKPVAYSIRNTI